MLRTWIRRIAVLGVPLLAGNLSHYLMRVVDLAMLGRLGTTVLAAAGIATMTTGILYTFVWPVSVGVQALASRRFGRQRNEGDSDQGAAFTGRVVTNGIIAGWTAVSIALFLSLGAKPALTAIISSKEIVRLAVSYVHILRWSSIILSVGLAMRGFLSAVNRTGIIMVATISANVANIFFNWVLIFGNLGFSPMGIRGAALGTLLSEALLTTILAVYMFRTPSLRRYRFLRFSHANRKVVADIIRVMAPPAIQNAIALAIFLGYQAMIERLGTNVLAVTGLVFAVFRINKTLVGGFAQGASIVVGNELGAGRPNEARNALLAQEVIASLVAVAVALALIVFPRTILSFFALEEALVPLGVSALRFFAGFFFIEVLGYSFEIVFSHNGWGRYVLVSEFVTNVVFLLGATAAAIFLFEWGVFGAWSGFAAYQIFHAAILLAGFWSGRWKSVQVE